MSDALPPLAAIRVFEAAARCGSFSRAAEELAMTQASVSYQIKVLEERVGEKLFLRKPRGVELTEEGHRLAEPAIAAFNQLRAAFHPRDSARRNRLVISITPTFAHNWLAARLGRFHLVHEGVAVQLDVTNDRADFQREDIDVAIRYGDGQWDGLVSHRLMNSQFAPMIGGALATERGPIDTLEKLLQLRIVTPRDAYWPIWLKAAGGRGDEVTGRTDHWLYSQNDEALAAIEGHGVAMISPRFFKRELAAGLLVQPFDLVATDGFAYWLVYPEARRNQAKIRKFRDWIIAEAAEENDETPPDPSGGAE